MLLIRLEGKKSEDESFVLAFEVSMKDPSKGDLNRGTRCVAGVIRNCVCVRMSDLIQSRV